MNDTFMEKWLTTNVQVAYFFRNVPMSNIDIKYQEMIFFEVFFHQAEISYF